jgi:hypothetical protein
MSTLTLDRFSQRGLNLLGTIFGGGDVRVLLSGRATHPATAVLESRTVVLDPKRAGLYDLALCARLLKHRALRQSGPQAPDRLDRWLTKKARRELVPRAQEELRREYPGIVSLPGRYRPGSGLDGLRVVARSVEWEPLPSVADGLPGAPLAGGLRGPGRRGHAAPWGHRGVEFTDVPDLEITGAEEDYSWLVAALEEGRFPLQTVPGLEELPFLRVPFRLCLGESCPTMETIEQLIAQEAWRIESFMDCYRRKSEVRQVRRALGRRTRHGTRLDTNRLVEAVVARRSGNEPRLFRQPGTVIEPVFDPREHLAVLAFDVNDLRLHESGDEHQQRATHRFLACLLTAYQRLEVDCVVLGFADQLLTLADGRNVCLHFPVTLKRLEEPFDDGFWGRLAHLLHRPPRFPGRPTCFHPLSLRDMTDVFDEVAREQDHSYRATLWWARRGMHSSVPEYSTTDFLMRTADHVDHEMQEMERNFTGTLDTLASFLPRNLKDHGRPGGFLQSIQIF